MKTQYVKLLIILLFVTFLQELNGQNPKLELHLKIINASPEPGQLIIDLYQNSESYQKENPYKRINWPKKERQVEYIIKLTLPEGNYGIAIIDDKNLNAKIDRNFIGYPLEGFGFYGITHFPLKKPSYSNISFKLFKQKQSILIYMQYH